MDLLPSQGGLFGDPDQLLALAAGLFGTKKGDFAGGMSQALMGAAQAKRAALGNQLASLQVQQQQQALAREKARASALQDAFGGQPQQAPQMPQAAGPQMSAPQNPQPSIPSSAPADPRAQMRTMYYNTAKQLAARGFGDDAQKFFDMAIKLEDEYSPTPQTLMMNGQPVTTLVSKQGNTKTLSDFQPKPEYKEVNTGDRVGFVDPLTNKQGPSFAMNISPSDQAKLAIERQNLGINQQKLKLEQFNADPFGTMGMNPTPATNPAANAALTGDAFLSSLPKAQADQIKALAEGRMQFPAGFALKSPYWQGMLQAVSQYDPSFDAVNYPARAAVRKDFTAGKSSQSLNALNTVAGHLEEFDKAISSLNNSNFTPYNFVANKVSGAFGNPAVTNYQTVLQTVAPELERAYRGAGGSEGSLQRWQTALSGNNGIEQQRAAIRELATLLNSKIQSLGDTYNKGLGTTSQGLPILSQRAKAVFDRLSGEKTPGLSKNPDGSYTYTP